MSYSVLIFSGFFLSFFFFQATNSEYTNKWQYNKIWSTQLLAGGENSLSILKYNYYYQASTTAAVITILHKHKRDLRLQLLFHFHELLFGHSSLSFPQSLQLLSGSIKVWPGRGRGNLQNQTAWSFTLCERVCMQAVFFLCMWLCVYAYVCVHTSHSHSHCVCACVWVRAYIIACVCMCLSMCGSLCMFICMHAVYVWMWIFKSVCKRK